MSTSPPSCGQAPAERRDQGEQPHRTRIAPANLVAALVAIVMVTVTPWLFGGVQGGVQVWLFAGAVLVLICWLIKCLNDRPLNTVLPVAVVPLICAVALGAFQLVPLGAKSRTFLSPRGAELSSVLLHGKPSAEKSLAERVGAAETFDRQPLSLYPASTRRDLALLVLAVAVFLAGAVFFKTPRAQIWLCVLVAANGAALAFFGLVQQLTWNGMLYWSVPLTQGGGPFGPFVNRNNAAGFLGLGLAGAVGMTVWAVGRSESNRSEANSRQRRPARRLLARARQQWWQFLASLNALTIVSLCLVALIVAGIVCSLSRGAWLATVGAAVLTTLVVFCARRRTLRPWWMGTAAMAGLALVGWVGMSAPVHARFATLLDQDSVSQTRIPHWRDGLNAAGDFWRSGSGLGTYRYVYGLYQRRLDELWYYHAENQYLEALVEGGIIGLGLMLIMIALVGMAAWRLLRHDPDPRAFAFGVAGVFALGGQAIHAFFDFALYVPANLVLFALLCGSISGRAAGLAQPGRWPGLLRLPRLGFLPALQGFLPALQGFLPALLGFLPALLAASGLAAGIWGTVEIRRVAAVERALKSTDFPQTPDAATSEDLLRATKQLGLVLEGREDDAEAQYRMARLWIHLYRLRAFRQLREEDVPVANDAGLWQLTLPAVVHGRAHDFARRDLRSELERLRSEPVVRDHLLHALRHLVLARRGCPLLPDVHLMTGALSVLAAEPADDLIHFERVRRLAPADPDLLFRCGVLETSAGRRDAAYGSWRKSLALSPRYLGEILQIADPHMARRQTIETLLPESPTLLIRLARERYAGSERADVREALVQRAEHLIEQGRLPEDERCYLRGSALALKELYPQAIANYSRAVALRVRETGWRYELALALKRQGMLGDAWEQARLCVRMKPDKLEYRTLLEEINHLRLTTSAAKPK